MTLRQRAGTSVTLMRLVLLLLQAAVALLLVVAAECVRQESLGYRGTMVGSSVPRTQPSIGGIRGSSGSLLQGSLSRARLMRMQEEQSPFRRDLQHIRGEQQPFPEDAAFIPRSGQFARAPADETDLEEEERDEQAEKDDLSAEKLARRIYERREQRMMNKLSDSAESSKENESSEKCNPASVRRRNKNSNNNSTSRSKRSGYRDAYHGAGRGAAERRPVRKENNRTREKRLLDEILGNNGYDRKIRPSSANRTDQDADYTRVVINLMIRSISKIDDYNMEFSIQMTFREQWNDDRLQYNDDQGKIKYLTLTETDKIWMPDLFFKNEKTGHFHEIILPNTYIRIYPNGDVLYSIRISLTLSCPMNLELYPLDTQTCELLMASYGWTTEDLVFKWKQDDPVQVTVLHLPRFTLEDHKPGSCDSKTNTGSYSCLRVDLIFKREFSYYLIQYYIPCCMLVMVSWVSFWLDQHAVPARVSLGVTTLLTMSTQNAGINQSLPPVSYTKAIDVWTGVCLTFVFGALLEFALVNYASRSDFQRDQQLMRRRWETDSQLTLFDMHMQHQQLQQQRARYMAGCTGNGDERTTSNLYAAAYRSAAAFAPGVPHFAPANPNFSPGGSAIFPPLVPPLVNGPGTTLSSDGVSLNGGSIGRGSFSRRSPFDPVGFVAGGCGMSSCMARFCNRSKRIDVIARITFPVAFTMFNIAYWTLYLKDAQL